MEQQIEQYLEAIKADYVRWKSPSTDPVGEKIRLEMIEKFCNSVEVSDGNKYLKVSAGRSVHSFIVKADNGKFKQGDILKAASYSAPAKNFARGNVLDGGYTVSWTGV